LSSRPEFVRRAMPRTPLPSLAWDELAPRGVTSIYEPFMGMGTNLYAFKRHGLRVVGSDLLECTWSASRAITENNSFRLTPEAIASFSLSPAPTLEHHDRFASWAQRGFFDPHQAAWLGYWRDRLEMLDGYARDLATVAVGWILDNWIKSLEQPGVAPASASAVTLFLKRANQWVWDNGQTNAALRGRPGDLAGDVAVDACYLYLEPPMVAIDLRSWLFEAWLQGRSEAELGEFYQDNPFYGALEAYRQGVLDLFQRLEHIPYWAIQYRTEELDAVWGDRPIWLADRQLIAQQHLGMGPHAAGEMLCIAARPD